MCERDVFGRSRFQSTPSVGRATKHGCFVGAVTPISIHALRGEGDDKRKYACVVNSLFQSTPSVGRATSSHIVNNKIINTFQSTPSVGRATHKEREKKAKTHISIHALRGEGDLVRLTHKVIINLFQSTPSVGRATCTIKPFIFVYLYISIHALRGEGDFVRPCDF